MLRFFMIGLVLLATFSPFAAATTPASSQCDPSNICITTGYCNTVGVFCYVHWCNDVPPFQCQDDLCTVYVLGCRV